MSIVNRRNAILGWVVWKVTKYAAKEKARQAVEPAGNRRGKAAAVVSGVAATGGALYFWRRRRSDDES
ncbi:MAG: hypothetical protein ACRDNP_07370 [Gaiellaceae bacterium]